MIKTIVPKSDVKADLVRGRTEEKAAFLKQIRKKSKLMYSQIFYHCLPRRYGMAEVLLRMQAFVRGAAGRAGAVSA